MRAYIIVKVTNYVFKNDDWCIASTEENQEGEIRERVTKAEVAGLERLT